MKKLLLFFSLLCVFITSPADAKDYVVKVPVLNIRSCAGINCDIVGKLQKGDVINVKETIKDWARIETSSETGFVIKTSIRRDNTNKWIFGISIFLLLCVFGVAAETRCDKCKKWWAFGDTNKKCIEEKPASIKKDNHNIQK